MEKERGINPFDSNGVSLTTKEKVERAVESVLWLGSGDMSLAGLFIDNMGVTKFGMAMFVTNVSWSFGQKLYQRYREFNP